MVVLALVCYPPTWFVTHPLGNKSHLVCYPLPSYHLTILPKSQVPTPPCHLNILPSHENEERDSYHLTILPSHETRKGPVPSYHQTDRRSRLTAWPPSIELRYVNRSHIPEICYLNSHGVGYVFSIGLGYVSSIGLGYVFRSV